MYSLQLIDQELVEAISTRRCEDHEAAYPSIFAKRCITREVPQADDGGRVCRRQSRSHSVHSAPIASHCLAAAPSIPNEFSF